MIRDTGCLAARRVFCIVVLCLAAGRFASAGRERFRDPDPHMAGMEVWRITDNPAVRNHANYHNTQCWSPDGRYICYYGEGVHVYDLHEDRSIRIDDGACPRWAKKHNWLFYVIVDRSRGPRTEKGASVMWMDLETGQKHFLCHGFEFLGETDMNDTWLFANQIFRKYTPKKQKLFTTARIPIRPNARPEFILRNKGRRPLPNPRHPLIMQRYKPDKKKPFGSSRIWFDYDGKNIRTAIAMCQAGHQCWLGNGEYHLVGDDQIRGRKWNEPFPSDMHFLANCRAHDICPCGLSGRWVCSDSVVADLRSGGSKPTLHPKSRICYPKGSPGLEGHTDCDPKGSPDGTKICFVTTWNLKDSRFTRITQAYSTEESARIHVESTAGFPESGAIVQYGEVIGYERKTPTTFEGLTRGLHNTPVCRSKKRRVITLFSSRLVPESQRNIPQPNRLQTLIKDEASALYWQRLTDVYVVVVRRPDPPHLRINAGRVELIPGENHWETFGYHILKDGKPITEKPIRPGATLALPGAGTYTASAVEFSDLQSKPGLALTLDRAADLVALKDKPEDFSWTLDRWIVDDKQVSRGAALKAPKAKKEIVHLHDGVIHVEFFEKGRRVLRHDLNAEGKATRILRYKDGRLSEREYCHGPRTSIEYFGPDGYKTHDIQWSDKYGKRAEYSRWSYDRGTPIRRVLGGRDEYVKQGDQWVKTPKDTRKKQ